MKHKAILIASLVAVCGSVFSFSTAYALYIKNADSININISTDTSTNVALSIHNAQWLEGEKSSDGILHPGVAKTLSFGLGAQSTANNAGKYIYDQPSYMGNLSIEIISSKAFVDYFSIEGNKLSGKIQYDTFVKTPKDTNKGYTKSDNYYAGLNYTFENISTADTFKLGMTADVPVNMIPKEYTQGQIETFNFDTFKLVINLPTTDKELLDIGGSNIKVNINWSGASDAMLAKTPYLNCKEKVIENPDSYMFAPNLTCSSDKGIQWLYVKPSDETLIANNTNWDGYLKDKSGNKTTVISARYGGYCLIKDLTTNKPYFYINNNNNIFFKKDAFNGICDKIN